MKVKKFMNDKEKDDVFYVCTLLEYIARETYNHRSDIIKFFDRENLARQLRLAEVNHCLTLEQAMIDVFSSFISDEISDFNSNIYYSNPDYIKCSYLEGKLLP